MQMKLRQRGKLHSMTHPSGGVPDADREHRAAAKRGRLDLVIAAALGVSAGTLTLLAIDRYQSPYPDNDVWFGADIPRLVMNLAELTSGQERTSVHPLAPLVYAVPVTFFRLLGLDGIDVVKAVMALTAAAWLAAVFLLGRLLGLPRADAVLLSAFAASTAAAIFWMPIPETYPLGSLTLLGAFCVVALAEHRRLPEWAWLAASLSTFAITTTNWSLGLLAALRHLPWRRAVQVSVNALAAATILWGAQSVVFPDAGFFFEVKGETKYVAAKTEDHVTSAFTSLLFHTVVSPRVDVVETEEGADVTTFTSSVVLTAQGAPPRTQPWLGLIATGLWCVLLAAAVVLAARQWRRRVVQVAGLFLLGQLALHGIYGAETFLYTLNFLTGILVLISVAVTTRWRRPLLALVVAVTVTAAVTNVSELDRASDLVKQQGASARASSEK